MERFYKVLKTREQIKKLQNKCKKYEQKIEKLKTELKILYGDY